MGNGGVCVWHQGISVGDLGPSLIPKDLQGWDYHVGMTWALHSATGLTAVSPLSIEHARLEGTSEDHLVQPAVGQEPG